MDKNEFEDLLQLIVTSTVSLIMKKNKWDEDYALTRFVLSKVYTELEKEETKVCHLSSNMLAILFEEEREGRLLWPDIL